MRFRKGDEIIRARFVVFSFLQKPVVDKNTRREPFAVDTYRLNVVSNSSAEDTQNQVSAVGDLLR